MPKESVGAGGHRPVLWTASSLCDCGGMETARPANKTRDEPTKVISQRLNLA